MRFLAFLLFSLSGMSVAAGVHAGGEGLSAGLVDGPGSHRSARVSLTSTAPLWRADPTLVDNTGLKVRALSVMGDVYLGAETPATQARSGGFRATSGIIIGSPVWGSAALASAKAPLSVDRRIVSPWATGPGLQPDPSWESGTLPYVGVGYSSLASQQGWSFSADLGVVSLSPGKAVRFGRGGVQGLDEVVRDLRLTPVLQLGVSYAF